MREVDAFSIIVDQIYDAALDPGIWPEVIRLACEYVGGVSGALVSHDFKHKSAHFFRTWNDDPKYTKQYFEKYVKLNPALVPLMNVMAGDVVAISTLIPYEEYVASRLYKEWVAPQGYADSIHTCLVKTATEMATFAIARSEAQGIADQGAFERMRLLVPHLRRAVSVGNAVHQNRVEAAQLAGTLDGIAAAIFLVDASGNVVHANAAGNKLMDLGTVFRTASNRLASVDRVANQLLAEAIAAAVQGDLSKASRSVAVPIEGDKKSGNWLAHVLPLTSGERRRAGVAYSAVAAVFARKVDLDYSTPVETAARLYRLTDAELRVLFAFMASEGIADAAAILGISQATVRSHVKSIFHKTGTNRQSSLVKLVASLSNPFTA